MTRVPLRPAPPPPTAPQSGAPTVLWAIVGVMTAIELILGLSSNGLLGLPDLRWPVFALGAFWDPLLSGRVAPLYPGQTAAMFVTHAFLHGGLLHLAMNGVVLLSLGKHLSSQFGTGRMVLVLLLSAIGGGAMFGLLAVSDAPMIGASGAVFGLFGLWQAGEWYLRRRQGLPLRPVLTAIAGLVAANIVLMVALGGGLAWQAHLGGWLAGWIAGHWFLRPR